MVSIVVIVSLVFGCWLYERLRGFKVARDEQEAPLLTLERATKIVDHAEELLADQPYFKDAFTPYQKAGAIDRKEACLAIRVTVADFYCIAARSPKPDAMETFRTYSAAAEHTSFRILTFGVKTLDDVSNSLNSTNLECVDSFAEYLQLLSPTAPDFWPAVFKRLKIENPVDGNP